jgi:hypothetical protein
MAISQALRPKGLNFEESCAISNHRAADRSQALIRVLNDVSNPDGFGKQLVIRSGRRLEDDDRSLSRGARRQAQCGPEKDGP